MGLIWVFSSQSFIISRFKKRDIDIQSKTVLVFDPNHSQQFRKSVSFTSKTTMPFEVQPYLRIKVIRSVYGILHDMVGRKHR